MLLKNQSDVHSVTPMPVEFVDNGGTLATATSETVTFNSVNSGAWVSSGTHAIAAKDIIVGVLTYRGVVNSMKYDIGTYADTSFSWDVGGTQLTTKVNIPEDVISRILFMTPAQQIVELALYLTTDGDYFVDHRRGIVFGKAVDTSANQAATYSYLRG
jgi:hypothetical protein